MIRAEHAAWVTACELVRATARAAARGAAPADKGRRAGQPVHPREISFTAARRPAITTTRNGTATASLPGTIRHTSRQAVLHDLGRRRVTVDRGRHHDHKTKARQAFPPPDAASPPAPRPPASSSAARSPPDTPALSRNPPASRIVEPAAPRSVIQRIKHAPGHDHCP